MIQPMHLRSAGLLCAVFSLLWVARVKADPGTTCGPAVLLDGPPDLVLPLQQALQNQQISTTPIEGCARGLVHIDRKGEVLLLTMIDPYDRVIEREVSGVAVAAALVESWMSPAIHALPVSPQAQQPDPEEPLLPIVEPSQSTPLTIFSVRAETSIANDTSLWVGGSVSGCVLLRGACVGVLTRVDADTRREQGGSPISRWGLGLLLHVDAPLLGGLVNPGVGVGLGWLRTSLLSNGDDLDSDEGSVRLNAHLSMGWPVGRGLLVEGHLAAEVIVLDGQNKADVPNLPEEPGSFFRVGFGLRHQAP